jgi:hypothetical protein
MRPRKSAAATFALAILRLKSLRCLHLQSGGFASGLQKLLRLRRFGCWCCWRWRVGYRWWCCVWRGGRRCRRMRACGRYLARGVGACGAAGEGHKRDVAGALDGDAQPTLVARADAGHSARENLSALLHELGEDVGTLVVDKVHFLDAELADFFLAEILALAAGPPAWTARSTRAAFAARTAVTAPGAVSAAVTTGAFTSRCAAGGLRLLLLFICHNCLPFPFDSDEAEVSQIHFSERTRFGKRALQMRAH